MVGNQGDIHVIYDYQNVIYIDPNKVVNLNQEVVDRGVIPEDFVMYANLETKLIPRTKLLVNGAANNRISTVRLGSINFLNPTNSEYLTSNYYNEFTGKDTLEKRGVNQKQVFEVNQGGETFFKDTAINVENNALFGIKKISIKTNSSFIPTVSIEMEDVQGRALFSLGDQSPYAAFFNLPYPPFYLTIKGYYGKAVRYELCLVKFNSRFNNTSGDYSISLEFIGFKYNVLSEINMGHLLAAPHMYSKKYQVEAKDLTSSYLSNQANTQVGSISQASNSTTNKVLEINTELGYQKILEVYKDYKSKGLIDADFPELTVAELINKLELFQQNILNNANKVSVEVLTDGKKYQKTLNDYYKKVRGDVKCWFTKYINVRPVVFNSGKLGYTLKKEILDKAAEGKIKEVDDELKAIIKKYTDLLKDNKSFGDNGVFKIKNNITYDFLISNDTDIDWQSTYSSRTGNILTVPLNTQEYIDKLFDVYFEYKIADIKYTTPIYYFNIFIDEINKMESIFIKEINRIERDLSEKLALQIANNQTGIGFAPTIKNVVAVIMASTEGFLRLLDDVHNNAWNVRLDEDRISSVFGDERIDDNTNQEEIVFPWPQVYIKPSEEKKNKYELIYPGDNQIISKTKAFLLNKWPEVEFVEEYLKGYTKRLDKPAFGDVFGDNYEGVSRFAHNSFEYPFIDLPYFNSSQVQFFYELWDRHYTASFNTGYSLLYKNALGKQTITNIISKNESKNIELGLSTNSIMFFNKIKNILNSQNNLNGFNYEQTLFDISNNGVSERYQKYKDGFINTIYLNSVFNNPSRIYNIDTYNALSSNFINNLTPTEIKQMSSAVKTIQPSNDIKYIYPFNNSIWGLINLNSNGISNKYNTSRTLFFNSDRNLITNFRDINDIINNRPFKYFPEIGDTTLTYGNIYQDQYSFEKSSSILNSPIFINSVQLGISKWRANNKTPYAEAAYLFLMSLPLSNLTDFLINKTTQEKSGFLFSSFTKYAAIHKLPFAWILKYGAIWHRYKKYVNDGVDILTDVWKDFDYVNNFYGNTTPKSYTFNLNSTSETIAINTSTNGNENTGYYPKTMNDFNVFLNGYDLFTGFTNTELDTTINRGFKVFKTNQYTFNGYNVNNWTTLVPINIYDSILYPNYCPDQKVDIKGRYYVLPSFNSDSTDISNTTVNYFTGKNTFKNIIHNGAIKVLLAGDLGTFNFENLLMPKHDEYFNVRKDEDAFSITSNSETKYAKVEDMLSVFDAKTLNMFENEFLNFSKSIYDIVYENEDIDIRLLGLDYSDEKTKYSNFQLLFRELMEVPANTANKNNDLYFKEIKEFQKNNFSKIIKDFLNYDVLFKYGNPSGYNKYYYNSFIDHIGGTSNITNPFRFKGYVVGTLPPDSRLITSRSLKEKEWKALQLNVGFSTIDDLAYTNDGSYITDFFIANNIEFSEENIINLAPIIKIYASQKIINPNMNRSDFSTILVNEQNIMDNMVSDSITNTLQNVKSIVNNKDIIEISTLDTVLNSKISKYDLYETFKAINDKWISGNDYVTNTLFEDVLFLDRGARNIGDLYFVDIFDLKKILNGKNINLETPVFNFIGGLMTKNNFNIFPMPSYVNFYGTLSPGDNVNDVIEGSTIIANDTWGNFTSVDYRKSGPKLVCVYAGRGSTTLNTKDSKNIRYGDDSFDMEKETELPFLEDQRNKSDWALSNKCVSFLVDAGIRNQAIFYGISVSQDGGTATAESLQMIETVRNNVGNSGVSTQNNSLLNLYKNLSYKATVVCFGNAIIQPTMYFNLQHIPLFNGPYFITEVSHEISPGTFETTFSGVRQSIYAPPTVDTYLASINENLLTKLTSRFAKAIEQEKEASDNAIKEAQNSVPVPNTLCSTSLSTEYSEYEYINSATTNNYSAQVFYDSLSGITDTNIKNTIYIFSYLASFKNNNFVGYNFNFGNVWLTYNRGDLELETYFCAKDITSEINRPFAMFENLQKYIDFMSNAVKPVNSVISDIGNYLIPYTAYWLYGGIVGGEQEAISSLYVQNLKTNGVFDKLEKKLFEALRSLRSVSPAPPTEVVKLSTINADNGRKNNDKLKIDCEFTYRNPRLTIKPKLNFLNTFEIYFESKNVNDLLYMENVNKLVENELLLLYSVGTMSTIEDTKIDVISGATSSFKLTFDLMNSTNAYTGFKIVATKDATFTENNLEDMIKSNQNYNNADVIQNGKKYDNVALGFKYYNAQYTKYNLYPNY